MLAYWRTDRVGDDPAKQQASLKEDTTKKYPYAFCSVQNDAYVDTSGQLHVLYRRSGESTQGQEQRRHAVFFADGMLVSDALIPQAAGTFCRIFQDNEGRFHLLGSTGLVYSVGNDGVTLGEPTELDLHGYRVEYSGFGLAVHRSGTARSNCVDFVFPSGSGAKWIYGRLLLACKDEQ